MDGHSGFQLLQELTTLSAALGRVDTIDTVGQFSNGQRAERDRHVTDRRVNVLDHVRGGALGSLGRDQDAGIED